MKLYVAEAIITDDQLCWIDDPDPVELESFLGVHDTPQKAMTFLVAIANLERQNENDLIDECETGEDHMPELELAFDSATSEHEPGIRRTVWTSGAVEFVNRGMVVRYQVVESRLNPTI